MKIFTISDGVVIAGAKVVGFKLKSVDVTIPAITVGEVGRGRLLGVLPVDAPIDSEILEADLGLTKTNNVKLVSQMINNKEECLVVLRTPIGFRGSNSHTGDRIAEGSYANFPGQVLVKGYIAQGDAGRMGGGDQLIAVIKKGDVFRTAYSGRRYGNPASHYYMFDGERILCATWSERQLSGIF